MGGETGPPMPEILKNGCGSLTPRDIKRFPLKDPKRAFPSRTAVTPRTTWQLIKFLIKPKIRRKQEKKSC